MNASGAMWRCRSACYCLPTASRSRRAFRCHARVCQLRVCQNKTCKSQGSCEILKFVQNLKLSTVKGVGCGCLGNCGNGPNIVILPLELFVSHVGTVSKMTEILETQCNVQLDPGFTQSVQLRITGNASARTGDLLSAEEKYSQALSLNVEGTLHLLYSNRSGVRLRRGDLEGALSDANSAIANAPLDFTTGHLRLIDVYYLQKNFEKAVEVLNELTVRNPDFKNTSEYAVISRQLQQDLKTSSRM